MVFSSIIFLFGFLPIVLLLFHIVGKRLRFVILVISSIFFYFYGENFLVWIMLTSTLVDYIAGLIISGGFKKGEIQKVDKKVNRTTTQKTGLVLSIVSNLAFLGYFKYFNFFVDNFNSFVASVQLQKLLVPEFAEIALPLGISFYTFQSMSYTIDVYRGQVKATRNFLKLTTFVTMFPQLVAGPIVRYAEIENQLNNHKVTGDQFVQGIERFIIGLAKKVIFANTMAIVADRAFSLGNDELTTGIAWLGAIAYTFQLYYDFSGYSCMAIGLGKMLRFDFPENFKHPFMSTSIREFWQRWHITLAFWFRDYVYYSVGGRRRNKYYIFRSMILVFFLCGLWHGASWNFVLWGLFHGLFIILEWTILKSILGKIPKVLQNNYTILIATISIVLFRADTLNHAMYYYQSMFSYSADSIYLLSELLQANTIIVFVLAFIFLFPVRLKITNWVQSKQSLFRQGAFYFYSLSLLIVLVFCASELASETYNPFIYFRF